MSQEKVSVSITLNKTEGRYEVKSSHPLPPLRLVSGFLPKGKVGYGHSYCRDYNNLQQVVTYSAPTITPKEWSEALAKATLFSLSEAAGADVELVNASEGGYLSIGNFVFKLSVADYVLGGQRALPVLRKRVLDAARAEGDKVIEAAQKKGCDLYQVAEAKYIRKMEEVNKLAEQTQAMRRGLMVTLPPWFIGSGLLFRNYGEHSYIGAWIDVVLQAFVYTGQDGTRYVWYGAPAPSACVVLWFPYTLTGEWVPEKLSTSGTTPHTGSSSSCLKLSSVPKLVSAGVVNDTAYHIAGVLSEVNMNSPYCAHREWDARVRAFVPEKLKATMAEWDKTGDRLSTLCQRIKTTADETTPPPQAHGRPGVVFGVPAEFETEAEEER